MIQKPFSKVDSLFTVGIFFSLMLIPTFVWFKSVGDISSYFESVVPPGQTLYLFSKLFGLYSMFIIALQLLIGSKGKEHKLFFLHPILGVSLLITVYSHVGLFVMAASLRSGHIAWEQLVPSFSSDYYKSAISIGLVAAAGLTVVLLAGFLGRASQKFRQFHRLAYLVTIFATWHALSIGTETRSIEMVLFFSVLAGLWGLAMYSYFRRIATQIGPIF